MSPRETYLLLQKLLPDLRFKMEYQSGSTSGYVITNIFNYRRAVEIINDAGLFTIDEKVMDNLYPLFLTTKDKIHVDFSGGGAIENAAVSIYTRAVALYQYLSSQYVEQHPENTIDIKFPQVTSLDELEKITSLLKRSFEIPLNEITNSQLKVNTLEKGSLIFGLEVVEFIELTALAGLGLKLCAELIWSATVIRKKKIEGDMMQEYVRSFKAKNELLETLLSDSVSHIKEIRDAEAEYIVNEFAKGNEPETKERVKAALEAINDLYDKGAEFHPSLQAPEEVKNLFPKSDSMKSIVSRIKQLKAGEDTPDQ